ncbi:MAG: ATP synthase F0 subunit C [Defluviitaleaceae bacterium]|nr:ATP synthase F0 subunit C [Defluviitaleaceae bacterium]MCL2836947.1 ATP synthase F0 subunit C [Defluviitaleaceae bacterium]
MHDPQVMDSLAQVMIVGQIASAIAVMTAVTTTFGQSRIASHAIDAIARQPEARGPVTTSMFVGLAMCETGGIYGLVIAILLLFANPLVGHFMRLMEVGL